MLIVTVKHGRTSKVDDVLKDKSIAPATLPVAKNGAFWAKATVAERSIFFMNATILTMINLNGVSKLHSLLHRS